MLYSNIVVAFDGSKAASKALDKAVELVKLLPDTKLTVVHSYDFPRLYIADGFVSAPVSVNQDYYELAEKTLEDAKSRLVEAGVKAEVVLLRGGAAEVILDYVKKNGSDLIVVGSRGLGGIREFVLGSVSHNIVQHATIPVLVVK
ncbi:MAG: universal stress protein [Candidatus Cohnella colombiensis]|uniref:Universal stress protein n=1 Tax=Candidatus Cohnella colombiensis TaxID=3121368 RepID=A0AA95EWM8_9BACL|nr:MAG: universal stress protein [Cohnella sp.]